MGRSTSYSHKEIEAFRGKSSDNDFELIVERIKRSGAEITKDESTPLYIDLGPEEHEVGTQRELEFNINRFDFRIIREVNNFRVTGSGKIKSLEALERPFVSIKLYKKPEIENDFVAVEIDELF